jgi:hypothetical protein
MSKFSQRIRPQSYLSSWIVNTAFDTGLHYLLIAGGGSGGASSPAGNTMGGGGAGGYISSFPGDTYSGGSTSIVSSLTNVLPGLSVSVVVGAGGPITNNPGDGVYYAYGTKGTNSSITIGATTITAYGGEKTTASGTTVGSGGGSAGAGGGINTGYTPTQGSTGYFGGGGAGTAASATSFGAPGNGLYSLISGTSVARGGGGGGGTRNAGGTAHIGGLGGGGNGATNINATSGEVNTGGGGGGAAYAIGSGNGGGGGSGVCIFNHASGLATPSIGAGLTGTVTTLNSRIIITITAGSGTVSWA